MDLYFKKSIYPKIAVLKASYSFLDRAYILIDQNDENYIVNIRAKDNDNSCNLKDEFNNEMLLQTARYEVYRQTKDIRKLIIARAMASTIIDKESNEENMSDDNVNVSEILQDWFEKNE